MLEAPLQIDPVEHLGLVWHLARTYQGRGLDLDDLVGEGSLAVVKASRRYDPARGDKWTTYAGKCIVGAIRSALENQSRPIRISRYAQQALSRGCTPESPELTSYGKAGLRAALLVLGSGRIADHNLEHANLAEFVPDHRGQVPTDGPELLASRGVSLDRLPPRDATVVRRRYGLDGCSRETLAEIGADLGVTREAVRQIVSRAIRKLRGRVVA